MTACVPALHGPRRASGRRLVMSAAALLTGLTLSACGGDATETAVAGTPGGSGDGGTPPSAVTVEVVRRGSIARTVTVAGVIEPIRVVGVNAQLAGALRTVEVEEGDRVSVGRVLARLDDREIQAQLIAAQANLEVVQASYDRAERLRERQVVTQAEFDRERAALAAAEAQREQLAARAGYATVAAPAGGVITEKLVEAGDVVGVQTRLFTIADVSTLVVRVGVSELDVVHLSPGDPVDLALDALPDRAIEGRIRRVFPSADPRTRLVPVEVELEAGARDTARPGFLARATFALGTREGVVLVPAAALVSAGASQAVFVVSDRDAAVRRPVATGLTSQGLVEIVEGLEEGERIVVQGATRLRDGAPVRIVEPGTPEVVGTASAAPGATGPTGSPATQEDAS